MIDLKGLDMKALDRAHASAMQEIEPLDSMPLWVVFADALGAAGRAGAICRQFLIAGIAAYLKEQAK